MAEVPATDGFIVDVQDVRVTTFNLDNKLMGRAGQNWLSKVE